MMPFVRLYSVE